MTHSLSSLSWSQHPFLKTLSGRWSESKAAWSALVADQPDNYRFINGLQISHLHLDHEVAKEVL